MAGREQVALLAKRGDPSRDVRSLQKVPPGKSKEMKKELKEVGLVHYPHIKV